MKRLQVGDVLTVSGIAIDPKTRQPTGGDLRVVVVTAGRHGVTFRPEPNGEGPRVRCADGLFTMASQSRE